MIMNCRKNIDEKFDRAKFIQAIKNSDMPIRKISILSGVPLGTFSGILYGTSDPCINTVIALANTLNLEVEDLI